MKLSNWFYFLIFITLFFQACRKDEPVVNNTKVFDGVDQRLWEYFERFENEAARRGMIIDLNGRGITAEIVEIEQENVGGICNYFPDNANELVIDNFIWNNTSEFQKELILFHELGHCYLFRDHRDDAHPDGFCKSIMRSGLDDCTDRYNGTTRSSYLDELFDPSLVP